MIIPKIPPQSTPLVENRGGDLTLPPILALAWWLPLNDLFSDVKIISKEVDDLTSAVAGLFISDTRANRANYNATAYPHSLYFETDTLLTYASLDGTWVYRYGTYSIVQASVAAFIATLTANDIGLLLYITDYAHLIWCTAAITTGWAPGEVGSGMMQFFDVDPTGAGWHLYDGSSVSYLMADGNLGGPITLPNLAASASYLKAGTPNTGVTAAVAPTITVEPITGTPSSTQVVQTGVGTTVAAQAHTHTLSGGTISSTGEPQSITRRSFFRQ